ncbi:gamma-glutamyl hydrolase-like isoform X2 [Ochlerotatus camptorhynchus]|uniref:gamma-glutamyl hydrolase-like isoform X2 n=1 Tax=Ochlerotatus camptorhynchus TaxID=644619 RepID=UPI0031CE2938
MAFVRTGVLLAVLSLVGIANAATVISAEVPMRQQTQLNEEPVIGVLAQEMSYSLAAKYEEDYESYIAASYVKFVEGAGARVVPIWINKPREYYEDILPKLNGVLLPGGATWFNQSNGYADAGRHIYDVAEEINIQGGFLPLWGTCLGFELLTYLAANGDEHRAHCSSNNQGLPLDFKSDFRKSRMFGETPDEIIEILASEPVTPNFHQYCVTEKNFSAYGLDREWRVMSTNQDWNGLEFISTIEHKVLPFYGIQFHPEKNIYEWVRNKNISHTSNAIKASQYFADFFVNEARKSGQSFQSEVEIDRHVIYNFPMTFTGLKKSAFEQCYLFEGNVGYLELSETGKNSAAAGGVIAQRYVERKKKKCNKEKTPNLCKH